MKHFMLILVLWSASTLVHAQKASGGYAKLSKLYTAEVIRADQLEVDKHALEMDVAQRDDTIADLTTKYEDLKASFDKVASVAKDTMELNQKMLTAYQELGTSHGELVDRYNRLLQAARDQALDNANMARSRQMMNALAIYNAMPKYAPPQTINLQVSDCTRLPALCVH